MMIIEDVVAQCRVNRSDLEIWIERVWVCPVQIEQEWRFTDEDIARIDLITDLMHDMDLQADAIDVILPLVDQIYDLRRSLRTMTRAVADLPADNRRLVLDSLANKLKP